VSTAPSPNPSRSSGYGRLDRQVILDAALRIAARPGASEVRFRDLGTELGADPTAVYRHFRNKHELMDALTERLMENVAAAVRAAAGWRAVLETMADEVLEQFTRHPAIGIHLGNTRGVGASELELAELVLKAREDAGLSGDTLIEHYGAMSGFALSYIATSCRELVTAGSTTAAATEQVPWLPDDIEVSAQTHPTLFRYGDKLAAMQFRSTYAATMKVLIDAVATAGNSLAE